MMRTFLLAIATVLLLLLVAEGLADDSTEEPCGRRLLLANKSSCRKSSHCQSGYCGHGKCRRKKAVGDNCYKNAGCKSGTCTSGKCGSAFGSSSGSSSTTSSSTASSTSTSNVLLELHNAKRKLHQAPALTWSPELASYAASYAAGCEFKHSGGQYGENLAYGGPASLPDETLFNLWYDEGKDYDYSTNVFSYSTGHFTQVVWKSTTQLGCATVSCDAGKLGGGADTGDQAKYLVCEYDPPGNYQDEFLANVFP